MTCKIKTVKFFTSFHNPRTKKYAYYYSIVLIIVSATIIMENLQIIRLSVIEMGIIFGEGFFSLVMLARHEDTKKQFGRYLYQIISLKENQLRD